MTTQRDLKASNILLDGDLIPKISDFGLARIFSGNQVSEKTKELLEHNDLIVIISCSGYMSPEYAIDGKFSVKSDVFSFGVLLIELVSGKKNRGFYHPDHHHNLLGHAWLLWNENRVLELMDEYLKDSFVQLQVQRCIQVGLLCVQKLPEDRPAMSFVLFMLENEEGTLPRPKQPGFFVERSAIETNTASGQSFELGFFSPNGSSNRYLGIWYKKFPQIFVWTANRVNPITDSNGVLAISSNGNLVLLNGSKSVMWSSNSLTSVHNSVAQLLDSGNLVLRENSSNVNTETYLWQSFDYPADTLLPVMKMGWSLANGISRYLTSWKDANDPSPGDFTYKLDILGLPQVVLRKGSEKKFRTGAWNGIRFGGISSLSSSVFKCILFSITDELYSKIEFRNKSIITRLTVNESGVIQRSVLYEGSSDWTVMYTEPNNMCHDYGRCGANDHIPKVKRLVLKSVIPTVSGILILSLLTWCSISRRKSKGESNNEDIELPLFDLATVTTATRNFSDANIIGEGGFGPVYKGKLSTGQEIAVKRLSKNSGQGVNEFKNEIILISKLQHRNLVRILGCCLEGEERMLVYEYMPKKSLDYFLFGHDGGSLKWQSRFEIAMGIAKGLLYLHQDSRLRIIHRDLKASNVLLDNLLNPRISDLAIASTFGGAQIEAQTKHVIGTYGYMSPEYAIDGNFSVKSDVFSFGVILIEIVSGKRNTKYQHPDHYHSLLGHAWLLWTQGKALKLMDTCLRDTYVESQVLRFIQVGLLCVQKLPKDRPTMSSVVFMLGNEGVTLPQPMQPGFFVERSSVEADTLTGQDRCPSECATSITLPEAR
ncbi:hypothetical protein RJ640_004480 [Escallonia rubra]|uniref:non-specific serine/threonine protein kinase n=1 Tax=Escallonia rubra TaxID=112253 RepID=A0AA88S2S4_9ASTE|nr:hypothetical protein RJ640_004480 [Escallonia rubra]